jgi:hypothetical protein
LSGYSQSHHRDIQQIQKNADTSQVIRESRGW